MNRRSIRLPLYDYSAPGEYFITICVKERLPVLGTVIEDDIHLSPAGLIVSKWIEHLREKYPFLVVNHFIIMPDHVHLIIEIINEVNPVDEFDENGGEAYRIKRRKMLLSKVIGYLKMNSAKEINALNNTSNASFWQANYYERIIRDIKEYHNVVEYIKNNPLNWHNRE
jgi:REP element-mobilizing transposase RayT